MGSPLESSLQYVEAARVKGPLSFYTVNPHASWRDGGFVCVVLISLVLLKFFGAGFQSPWFKQLSYSPPLVSIGRKFAPANRYKFAENTWYAIWHTVSFCGCLSCLLWSEWTVQGLANTRNWVPELFATHDSRWFLLATADDTAITGVTGWPFLKPGDFTRLFYLLQVAFWVASGLGLCFETRRSDFWVLTVHHIVTFTLLAMSWSIGMYRLGLIVLLVHDLVDVLLYSTKILMYCKAPSRITDGVFGLFMASWFIMRLILFPLCCVIPAFKFDKNGSMLGGASSQQHLMPGGVLLPWCLLGLLILHWYWFVLIARLAIRTMRGEGMEDTREEGIADDDAEPLKDQ